MTSAFRRRRLVCMVTGSSGESTSMRACYETSVSSNSPDTVGWPPDMEGAPSQASTRAFGRFIK